MKLNCKPGDLAVIVQERDVRNRGRFVRVLSWVGFNIFLDGESALDVWNVEVLQRSYDTGGHLRPTGSKAQACDSILRPIRDPGEDARDETLEWLTVPTRTPETA